MLEARLIVRDDWAAMIRIEKQIMDQSTEAVQATVDGIVADIKSSWSARSPSAVGNPPAMVTGALDAAVKADDQGRDAAGRFASAENTTKLFIRIDTSETSDDGEAYAPALEDPEYLDRPFLAPALERAFGMFESNMKRFVR